MIRPEVKEKVDQLVQFVASICMDAAKRFAGPNVTKVGVTALAWTIARNAALSIEEKLRTMPGGAAMLAPEERPVATGKASS
jgi:hypothetical protein